jgi:hypothetical protein
MKKDIGQDLIEEEAIRFLSSVKNRQQKLKRGA